MRAGLDIGYNKTAVCFPGNTPAELERSAMFPSVTGSADEAMLDVLDQASGLVIEHGGRRVAVGQQAIRGSRTVTVREDARWYTSPMYVDLFAAALTSTTARVYQKIDAVVGLPIAVYRSRGAVDDVRDRLSGQIKVRRVGRARAQVFEVDVVRVVPQPFGAALAAVLDARGRIADAGLAAGRFGVLDIGGGTTQALTVDRMKDTPASDSIPHGGWEIVGAVRAWLDVNAPGLDLRDHEIVDAIVAGEVQYFDGVIDLREMLEPLLLQFGEQVLGLASRCFKSGAGLERILVCGGGAMLIGECIKLAYSHAEIVRGPQLANARGFYRFARYLGYGTLTAAQERLPLRGTRAAGGV